MSFLSGPHACIGYRFSIVECVPVTLQSHTFAYCLHVLCLLDLPAPLLCKLITDFSSHLALVFRMKYLLFTMIRSFEFELAISPEDIGRKTSVVGRPFIASNPAAGTQLPVLIRAISETIMS